MTSETPDFRTYLHTHPHAKADFEKTKSAEREREREEGGREGRRGRGGGGKGAVYGCGPLQVFPVSRCKCQQRITPMYSSHYRPTYYPTFYFVSSLTSSMGCETLGWRRMYTHIGIEVFVARRMFNSYHELFLVPSSTTSRR